MSNRPNKMSLHTLYTNGSEIVGSHISTMLNKMLLHAEHIAYILLVQKPWVRTCQICIWMFYKCELAVSDEKVYRL
jgi:hypothetical protein